MEAKSSSTSTSSRRSQRFSSNEREGSKLCECGIQEVIWTSWTNANPGRRFYGCSNYRRANGGLSKRGCNHFKWCDVEPFSDRAIEVINDLKMEKRELLKENRQLQRCVEDGVSQELQLLSADLSDLKMRAHDEMELMKKRLKKLYYALVVSWLLIIYITFRENLS